MKDDKVVEKVKVVQVNVRFKNDEERESVRGGFAVWAAKQGVVKGGKVLSENDYIVDTLLGRSRRLVG